MQPVIRTATAEDAPAISQLIITTLHKSNGQDYAPEIIEQVQQHFSCEAIVQFLAQRQVYVATVDGEVVATASLDRSTVRSVFVAPSHQGAGIGRLLMAKLESVASEAGITQLRVPSSITAEGFYAGLGFTKVRDEFHGAERTIVMEKTLGS